MRNLRQSVTVIAWLWNVSWCQAHGRSNLQPRDLSEILAELEGAMPGLATVVSQHLEQEGITTSSVVQAQATPTVVDGPNGFNSLWYLEKAPGSGAATQPTTGLAPAATAGTGVNVIIPGATPPAQRLQAPARMNGTSIEKAAQTPTPVAAAPTKPTGGIQAEIGQLFPNSTIDPLQLINTPRPTAGVDLPLGQKPGQPAPAATAAPNPNGVLASVAVGTGTLLSNGACQCMCLCGADSFPTIAPALPPQAVPVASATTLSTVILPPTASVSLPSTLLFDTSAPPAKAPTGVPAIVSGGSPNAGPQPPPNTAPVVVTITTEIPIPPQPTQAQPQPQLPQSPPPPPAQAPPPQSTHAAPPPPPPPPQLAIPASTRLPAPPAAASSIEFSLTQSSTQAAPPPTAAPDLAGVVPMSSIDIGQFSLVSSLTLGNLGG